MLGLLLSIFCLGNMQATKQNKRESKVARNVLVAVGGVIGALALKSLITLAIAHPIISVASLGAIGFIGVRQLIKFNNKWRKGEDSDGLILEMPPVRKKTQEEVSLKPKPKPTGLFEGMGSYDSDDYDSDDCDSDEDDSDSDDGFPHISHVWD